MPRVLLGQACGHWSCHVQMSRVRGVPLRAAGDSCRGPCPGGDHPARGTGLWEAPPRFLPSPESALGSAVRLRLPLPLRPRDDLAQVPQLRKTKGRPEALDGLPVALAARTRAPLWLGEARPWRARLQGPNASLPPPSQPSPSQAQPEHGWG